MKVKNLMDLVLERTIVGSFSSIGYSVRSRTWETAPSMEGQVAVVTGGSSGIGKAAAAMLVDLGANVIVTSRSRQRAEEAAESINPDGRVLGLPLDTGSEQSIRDFVGEVAQRHSSVDAVLSNAGALSDSYRTADWGLELTLVSHLVGPFLMMCLFRPLMAPGGRIVLIASGGMYSQPLRVDGLDMGQAEYKGAVAYAKAKRAQVELAAYVGPRWAPDVLLHAVHPGWVDTPGVDDALPGFAKIVGPVLRTPRQGADTAVWLVATGGTDGPPGSFWHDRTVRGTSYVPGTAATNRQRADLLSWLEATTGATAILR